MFSDELTFLEECLKYNPKSYGSWEHRCYVMTHTPKPDWERELSLCNAFLSYDERNCKCNTELGFRYLLRQKLKSLHRAKSNKVQFCKTKFAI